MCHFGAIEFTCVDFVTGAGISTQVHILICFGILFIAFGVNIVIDTFRFIKFCLQLICETLPALGKQHSAVVAKQLPWWGGFCMCVIFLLRRNVRHGMDGARHRTRATLCKFCEVSTRKLISFGANAKIPHSSSTNLFHVCDERFDKITQRKTESPPNACVFWTTDGTAT